MVVVVVGVGDKVVVFSVAVIVVQALQTVATHVIDGHQGMTLDTANIIGGGIYSGKIRGVLDGYSVNAITWCQIT